MPIQHVSEFPASAPEQIDHFAKLLRRSPQRQAVFWEVCRGKSNKPKTAEEIGSKTNLPAKRVLEIAATLSAHQLFEKVRHNAKIAYRKYSNINAVKSKIMSLAKDKARLAAHVTVRNPKIVPGEIRLRVKTTTTDVYVSARLVTVDHIDDFSKVRSLKHARIPKTAPKRLPEKVFKSALAMILGNRGVFKDWGGEKGDLYTTHIKLKGQRHAAAFGLKGPAKKGTLTPGKMGLNGDQIQRLFDMDAQVFLVQYEGQIAETVVQQLKALAVNKSVEDRRPVFYGIIALEDSYRLRVRYKKEFAKAAAKLNK